MGVPTSNTHGSGRKISHCDDVRAILFRADVKCSGAEPSLRKSLGLGISRREREDKNFCFGQHAAIIFSRARIFRAITARDGEASSQRRKRGPSLGRSEYFKEDIFLQMSRGIFRFHGPYPFSPSAVPHLMC